MQRSTGLPGAGGDTVLLGFRHMLTAQFLQPSRGLGGTLEIEQTGIEDRRQRHLTHKHRYDPRMGIEAAQDGAELFALMAADQVDLAEQDHIGKLHLFDQQVTDRTLVVLAQGFAMAGQAFSRLVITQEVQPVDNRDHGVQPRLIGQAATLLITEGKCLGNR
ncbi:hypothetical protein D9M71_374800 [compost metagenome]